MWEMISDWVAKLLEVLYSLTGSWGIAIILFTLLVRVITHPLNKKQMSSMQKMQRLQPQVKVLQEKFKNDKEALSRETMQLYKDNKVNPMAGCLPLLVQLPIFILLYQVLIRLVSTEGFSATFLGIDLGESVYSKVIEACYHTVVNAVNTTEGFAMEIIRNIAGPVGFAEGFVKNLAVISEEVIKNLDNAAGLTKEVIKSLANTTGFSEGIVGNLSLLTEKVIVGYNSITGFSEDTINTLVSTTVYAEDFIKNVALVTEGAMKSLVGKTGLAEEVIRGLMKLKMLSSSSLGITNVGYAVLNNPAGLFNFGFYLANSIILLANGGLMWYQQKLTSSGNPQMATMNIMMPILITFICLSLPGGVLLYWGVSSLLAAVQQMYTSKRTKKEMNEKPALYKDKPMGTH